MRTIIKQRIFIITILNLFITFSAFSNGHIVFGNNSTNTRGKCTYYLQGTVWDVKWWSIDTTACVPCDSDWKRSPSSIVSGTLRLKWKNVEASAHTQLIGVFWGNITKLESCDTLVGPFTLDMPSPIINFGTQINIPCYSINPVTITLNPYVNTQSNDIDKGMTITSHFEWTLPSGWHTTSGETGTFVSSSSISVIPPASASAASISVRAKANLQYSGSAILQITRNLDNFTINGPTSVIFNFTYRYEVPSVNGVSYSWQLPEGWTGQSTGSYIDVTAGCSTGIISCTMTGCNQSKPSTITIISNVINPETKISGPSHICSSGATYTIINLPPVNSIVWSCGPYLSVSSGQNTASCTFVVTGTGNSFISARIYTICGNSPLLPTTVLVYSASTELGTNSFNNLEMIDGYGTMFKILPSSDTYPYRGSLAVGANPNCSYSWTQSSPHPNDIDWSANGATVDVYTRFENKTVGLRCTETNYCTSIHRDFMFTTNDLIIEPMAIFPNPAIEETTIFIESSNVATKDISSAEWDLEIYDQSQQLKIKKAKLKGNELKFNTSGWKEGIYIVRVKIGEKIISRKLVVKH